AEALEGEGEGGALHVELEAAVLCQPRDEGREPLGLPESLEDQGRAPSPTRMSLEARRGPHPLDDLQALTEAGQPAQEAIERPSPARTSVTASSSQALFAKRGPCVRTVSSTATTRLAPRSRSKGGVASRATFAALPRSVAVTSCAAF